MGIAQLVIGDRIGTKNQREGDYLCVLVSDPFCLLVLRNVITFSIHLFLFFKQSNAGLILFLTRGIRMFVGLGPVDSTEYTLGSLNPFSMPTQTQYASPI